MKSNYKKLGPYIQEVSIKNNDLSVELLLGVSITKEFIPSIANTVGTDMSKYKVVQKNQFAYGPVTSRNGDKISVALLSRDQCIISTSYTVFEIIDETELLPEYLMMWFRRPEFDRYARYMSHGSVRELFSWEEMCNVELPVPHIDRQREIVKEYHTIVDRIAINEELNRKLEETAQAIYKQWFVDFEFPVSKEYAAEIGKPELEGKPYKSSGGEIVWNEELEKEIPAGWMIDCLGEHINYKKGKAFKSTEYVNEGIPVVKVSTFTENSINLTECNYLSVESYKEYKSFVLKTNDIIISTVGSWPQNPDSVVGKVVKVPPYANQTLLNQNAVRINSQSLTQGYLYYSLKNKGFSDFVISGAQGSANQASITLEHTFSYMISIPSDREKMRLFKILDNCLINIGCREAENITLKKLLKIIQSKMVKVEATT